MHALLYMLRCILYTFSTDSCINMGYFSVKSETLGEVSTLDLSLKSQQSLYISVAAWLVLHTNYIQLLLVVDPKAPKHHSQRGLFWGDMQY